ncbi:hypothetical protein QQF64_010936 [Cirrhinus molitorella]|uniref:Uncharacterized protein n=1 Tax=Cirrhinus molitorella TaxID=172907 RepID=A0ABR3LXT2_9TELE
MTAGKILGLRGESFRNSEPVVRDMPGPPTAELGQTGLNLSPPDPTTKFQGDNAALSLVWSSLCLWPAKPVTTGSREQSLRAAFVGRPMSVESADLPPPLQRSAGEVEHTEGSQMPFSNSVSEVLQGNDFVAQRQSATGTRALFFVFFKELQIVLLFHPQDELWSSILGVIRK